MGFSVSDFSKAAGSGSHMLIRDDERGNPIIQTASRSFKGRVLDFMSQVPFLKELSVVKAYVQRAAADRAQVFGAFIHALSNTYSNEAVTAALEKQDLGNPPPLSSRLIKQLDREAQGFVAESLRLATAAKHARILSDARIPAVGFPNHGNTCYANASIKFLIGIVGIAPLIDHLRSLQGESSIRRSPAESNAIEQFISLLEHIRDDSPIDLRSFWKALVDTKEFVQFDFHRMNDAQEFIAKLDTLFQLQNLSGSSMHIQETFIHGEERRPRLGDASFSQNVNVARADVDLQDIVNFGTESDTVLLRWLADDEHNTEVEKQRRYVADLASMTRFNLHINALQYNVDQDDMVKLDLSKADFTQRVSLPILDSNTGEEWLVTLEPKDMIIHSGNANGGHYYTYSRQDDNHWVVHDDSTVRVREGVSKRDQAKFISFEIVDKVLVSAVAGAASVAGAGGEAGAPKVAI